MEVENSDAGAQISNCEADDFVAGPQKRAVTFLLTTPDIIRNFVKNDYVREHYNAMAEQAKLLIENKLKNLKDSNEEEVQAKVTYRAKTRKSLEEKLKLKNLKREVPYKEPREIWDDVKDLAGVRIVLYTPNQAQRNKVREVIQSIWPHAQEKHLDGSKESLAASSSSSSKNPEQNGSAEADHTRVEKQKYVRKHFGYQAVHYRAHMTENQGSDSYEWKEYDQVEIQVVSALGHAWAEAGHDVLYKTYAYGPPSEAEERILDALSGLVSSGDLLLEQFRELVTKRTYAKWGHRDELAIFLRQSDVLEKTEKKGKHEHVVSYHDHFSSETSDILFRFLVKVNNNYPLAIRNALKDLGYPHDPETKLREELRRFEPSLEPSKAFLAPFCLISHFLRKGKHGETQLAGEEDLAMKCRIMMDALILLQTFAGSPENAKGFLQVLQKRMTTEEMEGMDFVLTDPHRENCSEPGDQQWIQEYLQPAWDWFQKQAAEEKSLCGLFFQLAVMGVPAKKVSDSERLKELKIDSLSGI